jgi:hypothetical protein
MCDAVDQDTRTMIVHNADKGTDHDSIHLE